MTIASAAIADLALGEQPRSSTDATSPPPARRTIAKPDQKFSSAAL
jgi:hypothetical protein